jgi:hypothetical protein
LFSEHDRSRLAIPLPAQPARRGGRMLSELALMTTTTLSLIPSMEFCFPIIALGVYVLSNCADYVHQMISNMVKYRDIRSKPPDH